MNQELPDVLIGFRKGRGTKDKFPTFAGEKAREFLRNIYLCFINYAKAFDCVDHDKVWKALGEVGVPDHLTCLLRNLYMGQEATVRTLYGTTDWFKIEKEVQQGCLLSPRKAMTNLNTVLKSKDVTLLTKVHIALTIWSSQWSHMVVRAGPYTRQNTKELMP